MCELLDDENSDLNISIFGPGFVRTKTHYETIKAGEKAGENYERVKSFLESNSQGTSFEKIFRMIKWIISVGKEVSGGRNFSVVYDNFEGKELIEELKLDKNMYKLRRNKNEWK